MAGQDFIFPLKPDSMIYLPPAILSRWYLDILQHGVSIGVIQNFQGILDAVHSLNDFPYMNGDLWATQLNEAIAEVKHEENKQRLQLERLMKRLRTVKSPGRANIQRKIIRIRENLSKSTTDKVWNLLKTEARGASRDYFVIDLNQEGPAVRAVEAKATWTNDSRAWLNDRLLL